MSGFQRFNRATRSETPQFMNAEIYDKKFENDAQARSDALRSQNIGGAAETAKYFDADKSLTNWAKNQMGMGNTPAATNLSAGSESLGTEAINSGFNPLNASTAPITEAVPMAAPTVAPVSAAAPTATSGLTAGGMGAAPAGGVVNPMLAGLSSTAAPASTAALGTGAAGGLGAAGTGAAASGAGAAGLGGAGAAAGGAGAAGLGGAALAAMPWLAPLALALMA